MVQSKAKHARYLRDNQGNKKRLQGYVLQIIPKSFTRRMDTNLLDTLCCIYGRADSEIENRLLYDTQISGWS